LKFSAKGSREDIGWLRDSSRHAHKFEKDEKPGRQCSRSCRSRKGYALPGFKRELLHPHPKSLFLRPSILATLTPYFWLAGRTSPDFNRGSETWYVAKQKVAKRYLLAPEIAVAMKMFRPGHSNIQLARTTCSPDMDNPTEQEPPQCSGLTEQLQKMVPYLYDPQFDAKYDDGRGADFFFQTTRQLHLLNSAYGEVTTHVDEAMKSIEQKSEKPQGGDNDTAETDDQELHESLSQFMGNVGETKKALEKASQQLEPVVQKAETRECEMFKRNCCLRDVHPTDEVWLNEGIGNRLGSDLCNQFRQLRNDFRQVEREATHLIRRVIEEVISSSASGGVGG
ncbi:MAG: hypothetical protein Q9228_007043, partial [Teloschistes exilis]